MFERYRTMRRRLRDQRRAHKAEMANAQKTIADLTAKMNTVPKGNRGQIVYAFNDMPTVRTDEHRARFHTVGRKEISVQNNNTNEDGLIVYYLQENGYGDRRLALQGLGECWQIRPDKIDLWEVTGRLDGGAEISNWLMKVPDAKITTKLPPNADPEDRSWQALGAEIE